MISLFFGHFAIILIVLFYIGIYLYGLFFCINWLIFLLLLHLRLNRHMTFLVIP